jgi:lysophospholipid acyltransferase (LPLAT)-like uncharacterized protein
MAAVNPKSEAQSGQPSGVVVPHVLTFGQRLGAWLISILIRTVAATLRYRWTDCSGFFAKPPAEPAIYSIWHSRLALCMPVYFGYAKKRNQTPGFVGMVSASKDGAILTEVLKHLGVRTVRGSTSRRGQQALLEMTRWARRGYDLGITPDGPRGPSGVAQDGVIFLAQLTGLPIMPYSFHLGWKIRLKSWDRFQIPLPFSRCEVFFGKPIRVPRELSDAERETFRKQLETEMRAISSD